MPTLPHSFWTRPALVVAKDLIGCYLVRQQIGQNKIERYLITETEAYRGYADRASHAYRGRTKRNLIMFGPAGYFYIYFTYGLHWLLNIVTDQDGYPAAVLIRGIESANGPAKLTKKLNITGQLNGQKVGRACGLWIEPRRSPLPAKNIGRGPRIGIAYAGLVWSAKKWRFYLKIGN